MPQKSRFSMTKSFPPSRISGIFQKWTLCTLAGLFFTLAMLGGMTAVIDPYFHYHKPLRSVQYIMNRAQERYQNDGILKNFDYDAIIIGTSLVETMKTSEFDDLFHVRSVKVPFASATYREINENLQRAFAANSEIRYVVRCLDYERLLEEKDAMAYNSYPEYLYDSNPWNDVRYLFNKDVFKVTLQFLNYTRLGGQTPTFDEYANWQSECVFGKAALDEKYQRKDPVDDSDACFTEDLRQQLEEHLTQNITSLVEQNPNTQFYLFFSPYHIYFWDDLNRTGRLELYLDAERAAIEHLVNYENVHLFSFFSCQDFIFNYDNYRDIWHYSEDANIQILHWMEAGEHQLTKDNYLDYCRREREFFTTYDYDSLFISHA